VGITDHAQEQLGDLVYVELPAAGRTVAAGEACSVVESVKAASDVYSPLAGEIVEVNEALTDAPELINSSPYEEGWLFRVRPSEQPDAGKLLTAEDYKGLVEAD
jgi:glycine cleavage system H protein